MNIGISLLTCNDLFYLKGCMDSLMKSDIQDHEFTIYWWDNGSDNELRAYMSSFSDENIVGTLSAKNEGIVIPRIRLYEMMKGKHEYLLEIHADMLFPRKWIDEVFKLDDGETVIMMPTILNGNKWVLGIKEVEELVEKHKKEGIVECSRQVHPWIIRMDLLDNIGGYYDERYSPQRLEDDDLVYRVLLNNYKIRATENSIVLHYGQVTRNKYREQSPNSVFENKWGITVQEMVKKFDKHPTIQI